MKSSKSTFAASEISLLTLGRLSEEEARAMLERIRWPDGRPACPHCGVVGEATRMESREGSETQLRDGVWNCRACRRPFTVTVGTIFEGSHIELSKWLMGFYLFASSKKSMSALQLQRQLDLGSYRTAWHMAHRIRHAMQNDPNPGMLSGIIESDETYVGGKIRKGAKRMSRYDARYPEMAGNAIRQWQDKRVPVSVLVSRDGQARARAMNKVTGENVRAFMKANVDYSRSTLYTDDATALKTAGKEFAGGHESVSHNRGEYAKGPGNSIHSNTAEAFNGLFKRSIQGSWHHISREHIGRYLDEQCFRWSNRKVNDGERTLTALGRVGGVRLYYRTPEGSEGKAGLVARG
jgi:transposase-like protein